MAQYIVPQVLINQLISEVPLNTVRNQNVLVIGPNYELFRFAEEKAKTYIGEYVNPTGQEGGGYVVDASGDVYVAGENAYENKVLDVDNLSERPVIPYPGQSSGTVPDGGYTKVFADEVTIKLASLGDFEFLDDSETVGLDARLCFRYAIAGEYRGYQTRVTYRCPYEADSCECKDNCDNAAKDYRVVELDVDEAGQPIPSAKFDVLKRDINPGDAIRIRYGNTDDEVYKSTVVSVFESVPGTGIFDSVQLADSLPKKLVESDAVTDEFTPCDDSNDQYLVMHPYKLFNAEEEPIGPVEPGDSTDVCSEPEDSSEAGGDVVYSVQLCAQFSDVEISKKTDVRHIWNWDVYADTTVGNDEDVFGVVFTKNLRARYSNWDESDEHTGESPEYRVVSAKLYVQHRDLVLSSTGDISTIASHSLVEATLGTVHPDNPLAFGVYMAALNSGDRLVYFCGVQTDDLDGYNKVLEKATLTDEVYMICPTTMSLSVAQSVKAHCLEMSTAQNKLWRIGFVSVEPPATDTIYDRTNNPSGTNFYAKFVFNGEFPDAGCNVVKFMRDGNKQDPIENKSIRCLTDVQAGDVLRIWLDNSADDWDDTPHYSEFYISKVVSNNVLQLATRVQACDGTGACYPDMIPPNKEGNHFKVEVYRKLDPNQQVKYIAAQSSQLATRRMYNVFPSIASNDGVQFDGSFVACAVAGLVSSVLPQQPLTNVALNGINDIPLVYQTYTKAQLDTIAAGGTFIVMQDRPNSQVYVRHQISTDYTSNNLLKAELSITKNLDSISYYFAELFAPYIGKYNITPDLIGVLSNVLTTGLTALETDTAAGLYGPQVIEEGTEILWIRQSEAFRDHVECRVHLNLPVPFNYFDLDLEI